MDSVYVAPSLCRSAGTHSLPSAEIAQSLGILLICLDPPEWPVVGSFGDSIC